MVQSKQSDTMPTSTKRHAKTVVIECEGDVLRGVKALRRKCAIMRKVHDAAGDPPLRRRQPGFEGLARIVIGQQLSVASAGAIWERFAKTVRPMTAKRLAKLDDERLRAAGLSRPKIRTLRACAAAILDDGLELDAIGRYSDDEIHAALTAITGIGPWTADIFIMFCLGRSDAFAAGDLALQVAAQHAFDLDARPTADELVQLAEAWRPWRAVSARLLWSYYAVLKEGRDGIGV